MVNYLIRANGEDIPLRIVSNQTWGGTQTAIVYESAGTNGGVVVITGRKNNEIVLSGKLLADEATNPLLSLNTQKNKFLDLKDAGTPIVLTSPINNNDTGVYIITEFSGNVIEGMANYLSFTMTLTEYRQANLKRTVVNLISFEPAEEFKKILAQRQFG